MKKETTKDIIKVGIVIIAMVLLFNLKEKDIPISTIPGEWDITKEAEEQGYETYLVETSDFDYSNPEVFEVAQNIKEDSTSPEDAIRNTIRYVAKTITYNSKISIGYCYEEKASTVLESGTGDCVSMSRLDTALLRAQGIPTRTMGGCLSSRRCDALFATIPLFEPQVTEMVEGDFKKRGFLHEWVEVWTPSEGWRIIEATSGQLYPLDCITYLEYGYDTNKYDRCVITDTEFWSMCRAA